MPRSFPLVLAVVAALTWSSEPGAAPAPGGAPAQAQQQEFRAARVEIVGFHEAAVLAALRLRLPRLPIERHGGPTPTEAPYVYIEISRAADTTGNLRAITSDGRAYERSFTIEIGQEVRVAASTAASLLFSIEEGVLAPDRKDVAIPEAPATIEAPAMIEEPPVIEAPTPVIEPPAPLEEPPAPIQAAKPMPAPASSASGWELIAGSHGAALLGLGTRYGGALAGAGGGLALELRSPRGVAAALELRGVGRTDAGLGVGRLRVAVAGGYTLRRGRFELPMLLGLAVEPWWTTRAGSSAPIFSGPAEAARRPLLGGYLRITPAARLALKRGRLVGLRIGPRLELGGAFVIDDGARIVGLADNSGTQRFRLGGLELSLGLELALQFAAP
jgi:hypothetical protein